MAADALTPCARRGCPALATKGAYCAVHDPYRPPAPEERIPRLLAYLFPVPLTTAEQWRELWRK